MVRRERVLVYVEREDGLLVFDQHGDPEAGTQVPAGGVKPGEALVEAARREVREDPAPALWPVQVIFRDRPG